MSGELPPGGDLRDGDGGRARHPRSCRTWTSIIRTSGELRISNFLLWQGTYAEYDFPATAWPDFTVGAFAGVIEGYRLRSRRFGEVAEPAARAAAQP